MAAKRLLSSSTFRFSIRQLLLGTTLVAIGCVALRSASPTWVATLLGLMLLILTAAVPIAIFRQGVERAYWFGFALFGWLYMLLLAYSWSLDPNTSQNNPFRPYSIVTAQLSTTGYNRIYATASAIPSGYYATTPAGQMQIGYSTTPAATPASAGPWTTYPIANSPAAYTVYLGTNVATPTFNGPSHDDFVNVAHAFWAILLATCGGWFTCWLYVTRPAAKRTLAAEGSADNFAGT